MIEIIVSIISAVATIAAVVITTKNSAEKQAQEIAHKLETAQAVTDTKIDELTREVREHNNFAKRMPALEEKVDGIEKRVAKLEG